MPSVPSRRRLHHSLSFAALLLLALGASTRAEAQAWDETADAGDLVSTAQATVGFASLHVIYGTLASPADVDVYCVHLASVPPAGAPIVTLNCAMDADPNVWLFDASGLGLFTNVSCAGGNKTIVAPNTSLAPGDYYVAVSYMGLDPQSAGGAIWGPPIPGQRAPDGPGAAGTLTGWAGTPSPSPINSYTIGLGYMEYCDAPTPTRRGTWGAVKSFYR